MSLTCKPTRSLWLRARSSPLFYWQMRSTARRPKRSPRCFRPCRSAPLRSTAKRIRYLPILLFSPLKTRSNMRGPIRCRRPRKIDLCSKLLWICRVKMRNWPLRTGCLAKMLRKTHWPAERFSKLSHRKHSSGCAAPCKEYW